MRTELLWQSAVGLCAGGVVAAGLFTFIASLGIVTRLAQVTRTAAWIHYLENSFIVGGILGNLLWLYGDVLALGHFSEAELFYGLRFLGLLLLGLFGGIFTGCLIGAIAEILNAFPIFMRRLRLRYGFAFVVAALALGKLMGVLFQYFFRETNM